MILEGWRDAVLSGRYAAVHYHCASASVARWISRLAKKVGLTGPTFLAGAQMSAEEIATLSPAANHGDHQPADETVPVRETVAAAEAAQPRGERVQTAPDRAEPGSISVQTEKPRSDDPGDAAERERRYREIFGIEEAKPRRRWRR